MAKAKVEMFPLEGNSYPVREQLKALGCKWNAKERQWFAPESVIDEAATLVREATIAAPMRAPKPTRAYKGGRRVPADELGDDGWMGGRQV